MKKHNHEKPCSPLFLTTWQRQCEAKQVARKCIKRTIVLQIVMQRETVKNIARQGAQISRQSKVELHF